MRDGVWEVKASADPPRAEDPNSPFGEERGASQLASSLSLGGVTSPGAYQPPLSTSLGCSSEMGGGGVALGADASTAKQRGLIAAAAAAEAVSPITLTLILTVTVSLTLTLFQPELLPEPNPEPCVT